MLFDERPKDSQEDLFNRESEIRQFKDAISLKRPLIVISGHRRVGKTSLLKTMLNRSVRYSVFIDLRSLASSRYVAREDLINLIQSSLQVFLDKNKSIFDKIKESLRSVRGVTFGEFSIELEHKADKELDLNGLFSRLNDWAQQNDELIILAIDEAQEFRKSQHLDMSALLAYIYDNCKNIITVLTGSEVGLLHEFIGKEDAKAKLYGRSHEEIKLEPLSREKSKEFLIKGFEQYNLGIEKTPLAQTAIDTAAEVLGGVLGWLIKFGIKCVQRKLVHADIIPEIVDEGSKLAKDEFDKFLQSREASDRYIAIMEAIAASAASWKTIKLSVERKLNKKIYNKNLSDLLDTLGKSGFIIKIGDEYRIIDPLLRSAFTT